MSYDYWVVTDKTTGRVICHCAAESDALMMVSFDKDKRTYRKQKFIMDQVIDVTSTSQKQLPTNEIVVNMDGGVGGSWKEIYKEFDDAFGVENQKQLNQSDAEVFVS